MKKVEIKVENIVNPPEKMRLMYEAVSQLICENQNLEKLKVQDITDKAGIGKGTAYEYFSTKEELIASALMYQHSIKVQKLADAVFARETFRQRVYGIMDWIDENKEYNQIFTHLMKGLINPDEVMADTKEDMGACGMPFGQQAFAYILEMVDRLMEDGYKEGVFSEENKEKREITLLTSMCEYGVIVMSPFGRKLKTMNRDEFRSFIYDGLIHVLAG